MKVPLSWLKEYVDIDVEPAELMRRLTAVGHMQDGPAKSIAGDQVYDLEVRQNRSDCLSLIGVAREVAAVLETTIIDPLQKSAPLPSISGGTKLEVHDDSLCYRFNTLTLTGLTVGPSPDWMQKRLEAYGMKAINNIVDVTNYVMIEQGQPLHAFDLEKLASPEFHIRQAKAGEHLVVLGGKDVSLTSEDLIIADNTGPVALAGVIGGEKTSVSSTTTTIVLEAATYNQATVRRSALRHTLRTEASTRLEKFLHPFMTEVALRRAAELITQLAGGKVVDRSETYPRPLAEKQLKLRLSAIHRLGGIELSTEEAQSLLAKEMIVSELEDKSLNVTIPFWRTDIEQEADLVEEVLRLYGYDRIEEALPSGVVPKDIQSRAHTLEEQLRDLFAACGYDEQITEPLVNEKHSRLEPVRLQNSLSSEKVMLRTSLVPQLLLGASNRRRYRQTDIRLFEVGKVYFQEGDDSREKKVVSALITGPQASYLALKGVAEVVLERLGIRWEPGMVQIEPIDTNTFVLTLETEALLKAPKYLSRRILTSPPQLILEDWSLSVPQELAVGEVLTFTRAASPLVRRVTLGEEPRALEPGRKSLFVKVAYHDPTRTLSTTDTDPVRENIQAQLRERFNVELRG